MKTDQIRHEISRLRHALSDGSNRSVAYPILARHGFMETTPNGYKAIDPEAVDLRCRQLIAELSAKIPSVPFVDVQWIDDNDGCNPRRLSNAIRCF